MNQQFGLLLRTRFEAACVECVPDEAGDVGEVVHGVESEPEAADLVRLQLLGGAAELGDVVEVGVGEHGVVVHPERGSLALAHALVDEARARVRVLALVPQQPHLRGAGVVRVLHELL
jgi:hypothetical protein